MRLKILLILFLICSNAFSKEVSYLARSPKALLMGDAFTAIADDEYTLFYNPAALGRNQKVSITPIDPSFGLTNALDELDRFDNMPSDAPGIAGRMMDFPIYLQTGLAPTVKMAQFGLSLFLNQKTSMTLRNNTHPILDLNYRYDRGFIVGFAYNVGSGAKTSKISKSKKTATSAGERLSVGFAVKHMNREGVQNQFDLFGTKLLSSINSGATSPTELKNALGFSKGDAWGYDLGVEYSKSAGASTFTAGFSLLDIGDTRFTKTSGTYGVPIQSMMANAGVAYKQDFGIFDYTLSADLHPFLGPVDFARQLHMGAEVSFPFISLLAGYSEGYLSYGAAIDLWPFRLMTGFYGVEAGSKYKEQQASRFLLYLSLFDFSIDL